MENIYLIGGILFTIYIGLLISTIYLIRSNSKLESKLNNKSRPLKSLDFEKDMECLHTIISHEYNREITLYSKSKIGDTDYAGMDDSDFNDNLITISRNVQEKISKKYYDRLSNYMTEEGLREYITEKILLLLLKEVEQTTINF